MYHFRMLPVLHKLKCCILHHPTLYACTVLVSLSQNLWQFTNRCTHVLSPPAPVRLGVHPNSCVFLSPCLVLCYVSNSPTYVPISSQCLMEEVE